MKCRRSMSAPAGSIMPQFEQSYFSRVLDQNQLKDIPNSRLYAEMRELDLRIEQYNNRKKAEIFDLDQHHHLQTRTLRLHLYNQHFNQSGVDPNATPSWSLFIYGQFLDQDHALRNLALQGPEADKKVASRFWTTAMSSIEITTSDPNSDSAPVDVYRWQKNRHVGQHKEGIEIHRWNLGLKSCTSAKLYSELGYGHLVSTVL